MAYGTKGPGMTGYDVLDDFRQAFIVMKNEITKYARGKKLIIFAALTVGVMSLTAPANHLQLLTTPTQWGFAVMLAVLPTVMSLLLMVVAVHDVGSTPTAIMGALEPVTAMIISVALFGEVFTARIGLGIVLVLIAVTLIVVGKNIHFNSLTRVVSPVGRVLVKLWRWKS